MKILPTHWLAGKRDNCTRTDLSEVGESIGISRPAEIREEVSECVRRWPEFARSTGVFEARVRKIGPHPRLKL